MDFTEVNRQGNIVLGLLEQNGHHQRAAELQDLLNRLQKPGKQAEALLGIEGLCHIRCLGDLDMGKLSLNAWWGHLNNLSRVARIRLDQLK